LHSTVYGSLRELDIEPDTVIHGKLGLGPEEVAIQSRDVQEEAIKELMAVVGRELEGEDEQHRFGPVETRGGMELYRMDQNLYVYEGDTELYRVGSENKGKKTGFLRKAIEYLEEERDEPFREAYEELYCGNKNFVFEKRMDELDPFILEDSVDVEGLIDLHGLVTDEELPESY